MCLIGDHPEGFELNSCLDMNYSSEVRQRFALPYGAGEFTSDVLGVVSGKADDRTLSVWTCFQVQVIDGIISSSRFQVFGCPHTLAAASWVAEWLEGRSAVALRELDVRRLAETLEVPVEKLGKLLLIEDALLECAQALEDRT